MARDWVTLQEDLSPTESITCAEWTGAKPHSDFLKRHLRTTKITSQLGTLEDRGKSEALCLLHHLSRR